MSVSYLIEAVRDCTGYHSEQLSPGIGEQIMAALSAGEQMREMCDEEIGEILRATGFVMTAESMKEAREAWDAVMPREDV
jgi:hypothetical protein